VLDHRREIVAFIVGAELVAVELAQQHRDKLTLPVGGRCSLSVASGSARIALSGY
jgi:hypothetical protein